MLKYKWHKSLKCNDFICVKIKPSLALSNLKYKDKKEINNPHTHVIAIQR